MCKICFCVGRADIKEEQARREAGLFFVSYTASQSRMQRKAIPRERTGAGNAIQANRNRAGRSTKRQRTQSNAIPTSTRHGKLWVVNVIPAYEYKEGRRTQNITRYHYETVLLERKMDKISVAIDGPALLEPPNGYYEVAFEGLEAFICWRGGEYCIGAKTKSVKVLKDNT